MHALSTIVFVRISSLVATRIIQFSNYRPAIFGRILSLKLIPIIWIRSSSNTKEISMIQIGPPSLSIIVTPPTPENAATPSQMTIIIQLPLIANVYVVEPLVRLLLGPCPSPFLLALLSSIEAHICVIDFIDTIPLPFYITGGYYI